MAGKRVVVGKLTGLMWRDRVFVDARDLIGVLHQVGATKEAEDLATWVDEWEREYSPKKAVRVHA